MNAPTISIVTPTLRRPVEVRDLFANLSQQTTLPMELVLVDAAPEGEEATADVVAELAPSAPFAVNHIRRGGGTAIQRNIGIDAAKGDFITFVDDDIRLEPDFLAQMMGAFAADADKKVGGITGYITNQFCDPETNRRWVWYKRLNLFTTYEPGRYDFETGVPINRYLRPPHETLVEIDFMGAGCAVWRRDVFEQGVRFHPHFVGFGVLEDAHLSLQAGKKGWTLLECGYAKCIHLKSQSAREDLRQVVRKAAVNHRFVFVDIVPERTWKQEMRFWRVQVFDAARLLLAAARHRNKRNWSAAVGKVEGVVAAARLNHG